MFSNRTHFLSLLLHSSPIPQQLPIGPDVYEIAGQDREGHVVAAVLGTTATHGFACRIYRIAAGQLEVVREFSLPGLADRDYINTIRTDPTGRRIMFTLDSGGNYTFPRWVRRHVQSLAQRRSPWVRSLWTCDLDGTSLHEIGSIRSDEDSGTIRNPTWLPDGKSISFTHNNCLWIVPAP